MPQGHAPLGVSHFWGLGFIMDSPFPCMQEKRNTACGLLTEWKSIQQKVVLWAANGTTKMPQGHPPLGAINFWGLLQIVSLNSINIEIEN